MGSKITPHGDEQVEIYKLILLPEQDAQQNFSGLCNHSYIQLHFPHHSQGRFPSYTLHQVTPKLMSNVHKCITAEDADVTGMTI